MVSLRGIAQVNLFADDVAAARDWYADALGADPYFERPSREEPMYVEFRLGDSLDELGIVSAAFAPAESAPPPGGAIARWHVDDIRAAVEDLVGRGAREWEPVTEREEQFFTASVVDPFGNVLGLIQSPHFVEQSRG